MKHLFKKGHKKFGGRKMGTPNKSQELANKILSYVCNRDIEMDLQELYCKHLPKYWDIIAKFLPKPPPCDDDENKELKIIIKGYNPEKDEK